MQAFALELEQEHGKLDCLVNNAGFAFKVYSACDRKLTLLYQQHRLIMPCILALHKLFQELLCRMNTATTTQCAVASKHQLVLMRPKLVQQLLIHDTYSNNASLLLLLQQHT
jgi:NAD(P)-dependent dehydrogenase (short-subunit alcohol dehydrogenase family)